MIKLFLWDDANFYVHIKSQGHHEVYGLYGDKKASLYAKMSI